MNLLLYTGENSGRAQELKAAVEGIVTDGRLEFYKELKALEGRLHQPRRELKIAVLHPGAADFDNLVFMQEWFLDLSVVLILPDQNLSTLAKAHLLGPRYLTDADGDFNKVRDVLLTMSRIHAERSREIGDKGGNAARGFSIESQGERRRVTANPTG